MKWLENLILRIQLWKLKRKSDQTVFSWSNFSKNLFELRDMTTQYYNMLYKFGYIKPEDVQRHAEEQSRNLMNEMKEEDEEKLSYIG